MTWSMVCSGVDSAETEEKGAFSEKVEEEKKAEEVVEVVEVVRFQKESACCCCRFYDRCTVS